MLRTSYSRQETSGVQNEAAAADERVSAEKREDGKGKVVKAAT